MKAKDLMTPLREDSGAADQKAPAPITAMKIIVAEDASLGKCIDCLLQYKVNRLGVLDKNRKVVGIFHGLDIFSNFVMAAILGVLLLILWSMRDMVSSIL